MKLNRSIFSNRLLRSTGAVGLCAFVLSTASVNAASWFHLASKHFSPNTSLIDTSKEGEYAFTFVCGANGYIGTPIELSVNWYTSEEGRLYQTYVGGPESSHSLRAQATAHYHKDRTACHYPNPAIYDQDSASGSNSHFQQLSQFTDDMYIAEAGGQPTTQNISGNGWSGWLQSGYYSYSLSDQSNCADEHTGLIRGVWYKIYFYWVPGATNLPSINPSIGYGKIEARPVVTIREIDDAYDDYFGSTYPGNFRVTRCYASTSQALTVYFNKSGTAQENYDYAPLGNYVVIPPGSSYADIWVNPYGPDPDPVETLILTLTPNSNYLIGNTGTTCDPNGSNTATMEIKNAY